MTEGHLPPPPPIIISSPLLLLTLSREVVLSLSWSLFLLLLEVLDACEPLPDFPGRAEPGCNVRSTLRDAEDAENIGLLTQSIKPQERERQRERETERSRERQRETEGRKGGT